VQSRGCNFAVIAEQRREHNGNCVTGIVILVLDNQISRRDSVTREISRRSRVARVSLNIRRGVSRRMDASDHR